MRRWPIAQPPSIALKSPLVVSGTRELATIRSHTSRRSSPRS
jgi:hypothetical protein